MSDAPETIYTSAMGKWLVDDATPRWPSDVKYRRADLPPTLSAAMQLPEVMVLVGALCGLKRIIEEIDGAMDHGTWRDDKGQRLKDTPEWVAAYIALAPFTEAKP